MEATRSFYNWAARDLKSAVQKGPRRARGAQRMNLELRLIMPTMCINVYRHVFASLVLA